jgi:hypothetical protein
MPQKILNPRDQIDGITIYDSTVIADGSMAIIIAPRGRRWQFTAMADNGASGAVLYVYATLSGNDQIKDGNAVWNLFAIVPVGSPTVPDALGFDGLVATAIALSSDVPASEMPFQIGVTVHP